MERPIDFDELTRNANVAFIHEQYATAEQLYKQAIDNLPDGCTENFTVFMFSQLSDSCLKQGKLKDATETLERYLYTRDPSHVGVLVKAAVLHIEHGQPENTERAIDYLTKARLIEPGYKTANGSSLDAMLDCAKSLLPGDS